MRRTWRGLFAFLLISMIGCAPGVATPVGLQAPTPAQGPAALKRLTLAIISEPVGFHPAIETQRLSVTQAGLA